MAKLLGSKAEYSLFYRSRRVFRQDEGWYFEDNKGNPFGPFDKRDKVLEAVKVYQRALQANPQNLLRSRKKLG